MANRRFKNLKIENKNIDSLDKRFLGKVSKKELGFMKAILKMDPKERLSAKEALFHGYFDDIREDDIVPDNKTNQFIHNKNDSKVPLGNIKEERSNLEFNYLIHINLLIKINSKKRSERIEPEPITNINSTNKEKKKRGGY